MRTWRKQNVESREKNKPLKVEKSYINKISAIKKFLLLRMTQKTHFSGVLEK